MRIGKFRSICIHSVCSDNVCLFTHNQRAHWNVFSVWVQADKYPVIYWRASCVDKWTRATCNIHVMACNMNSIFSMWRRFVSRLSIYSLLETHSRHTRNDKWVFLLYYLIVWMHIEIVTNCVFSWMLWYGLCCEEDY